MDTLLPEIAAAHGWERRLFSGGWIQEFRKGPHAFRVYGYDFPLGGFAAHALARDKVAASELCAAYGVPCVLHKLVMNEDVARRWYGMDKDWLEQQIQHIIDAFGEELVVKPNLGQGGEGVSRVSSRTELKSFLDDILTHQRDYAVSPFIAGAREIRVILLEDEVLCMFEKQVRGKDWRHNLSGGAVAIPVEDVQLFEQAAALARRACTVLGLPLAAVDIFVTDAGLQVIEVNSGIAIEKAAEQLPDGERIAREAYEKIFMACIYAATA